jgi:hypothetical protein
VRSPTSRVGIQLADNAGAQQEGEPTYTASVRDGGGSSEYAYDLDNADRDVTLDRLTIGTVQRPLPDAGVHIADLIPADRVVHRRDRPGAA